MYIYKAKRNVDFFSHTKHLSMAMFIMRTDSFNVTRWYTAKSTFLWAVSRMRDTRMDPMQPEGCCWNFSWFRRQTMAVAWICNNDVYTTRSRPRLWTGWLKRNEKRRRRRRLRVRKELCEGEKKASKSHWIPRRLGYHFSKVLLR